MPSNKIIDLDRLRRFKDKLDLELETKANVDGNYPTMTVGLADNLKTNLGTTQEYEHLKNTPVLSSADEDARVAVKEIKGRSFVYNQLIQNGNFANGLSTWTTNSSSGTYNVSNGVLTYTCNGQGTGAYLILYKAYVDMSGSKVGHKYLISFKAKGNAEYLMRFTYGFTFDAQITTSWQTFVGIGTAQNSNFFQFLYRTGSINSGQTFEITDIQLIDLTQSGIDSATTVEQAIALLQQNGINPYEYNEYNTGTIIDSKPTAIVSKGFNVWDEEWEVGGFYTNGNNWTTNDRIRTKNPISVLPNTTYYVFCNYSSNDGIYIHFLDKNGDKIGSGWNISNLKNGTFTTTSDCFYIKFMLLDTYGTTYNHDICINISSTLNGTYRPYKSPITYPLSVHVLRSAGSVKDNNEKVNVIKINLWELAGWTKSTNNRVNIPINSIKEVPNNEVVNATCSHYIAKSYSSLSNSTSNMEFGCNNNTKALAFYKQNGFTNVSTSEEIANLFNGVVINIESATPTDQPSITLPENMEIELGGSLEIVYEDGYTTPCDFDMLYQVDLKGFEEAVGNREDINWDADEIVSHTELEGVQSVLEAADTALANSKQDTLVSGTNIKTLNNESLLGSGNISYDNALSSSSTNAVQNKVITQNVLDLQYRVAMLEEAIISEDTLSYTYLSESLIPQLSDNSYPIIQSGGLDTKEIKGRSFVYNQLTLETTAKSGNLQRAFDIADKITKLSWLGETYVDGYLKAANIISRHKYLIMLSNVNLTLFTGLSSVALRQGYSGSTTATYNSNLTNANYQYLVTANSSDIGFRVAGSSTGVLTNDFFSSLINIFDLTQSGIDSATTVDEAIALLQQNGINPYEYNEYNAGEIIDSKPTAIVSNGYNVFDEENAEYANDTYWISSDHEAYSSSSNYNRLMTFVKIQSGKNYTLEGANPTSGNSPAIAFYDKDYNWLTSIAYSGVINPTFTTPNNAVYCRFSVHKTATNICLHITGTRTGYAPYKAPITYQLDTPVLRSAGSVQDTNKNVNVGTINLWELNYQTVTTSGGFIRFYVQLTSSVAVDRTTIANILCSKLKPISSSTQFNSTNFDIVKDTICIDNSKNLGIVLNDQTITTNDALKTYLQSINANINYELANPTDQPSITLPENIEFEVGGSLEVLYDDGHTTPCDFVFDTAVYKPIQ